MTKNTKITVIVSVIILSNLILIGIFFAGYFYGNSQTGEVATIETVQKPEKDTKEIQKDSMKEDENDAQSDIPSVVMEADTLVDVDAVLIEDDVPSDLELSAIDLENTSGEPTQETSMQDTINSTQSVFAKCLADKKFISEPESGVAICDGSAVWPQGFAWTGCDFAINKEVGTYTYCGTDTGGSVYVCNEKSDECRVQ